MRPPKWLVVSGLSLSYLLALLIARDAYLQDLPWLVLGALFHAFVSLYTLTEYLAPRER